MYTSKKFPPAAGIDPTGKNVWFEGAKKKKSVLPPINYMGFKGKTRRRREIFLSVFAPIYGILKGKRAEGVIFLGVF